MLFKNTAWAELQHKHIRFEVRNFKYSAIISDFNWGVEFGKVLFTREWTSRNVYFLWATSNVKDESLVRSLSVVLREFIIIASLVSRTMQECAHVITNRDACIRFPLLSISVSIYFSQKGSIPAFSTGSWLNITRHLAMIRPFVFF